MIVLASEKVGDLNGDGKITIDDVVYEYAYVDLGSTATLTSVESRAKELYSAIAGQITRLPDSKLDDVSGDSGVNIDDVVLTYAYVDLGSTATTSSVESRAKELYSAIDYLSKTPGMEIGSSTVPVSISGITTNP